MDYLDCFVGGPLDGNKEKSPYRGRHPTVIGRQLVDAGLTVLGIYCHKDNRTLDNSTQRIFHYLKSLPFEEGQDYIVTNDKWKDD